MYTIRKPIFGNKMSLSNQTVTKKTLNGETKIVNQSVWPTTRHLSVEFRALTLAQKQQMETFMKGTAGQLITVQDHENKLWSGVAVGDPIFTQERDTCMWGLTFDFMVEAAL